MKLSAKTTMPKKKGLVMLLSIFLTEYDAAIQTISDFSNMAKCFAVL